MSDEEAANPPAAPVVAKVRRARKAKAVPAGELTIKLDGEDLAWLAEQAYPLGVSEADYLRMFVRQSRLGVGAMGVRGPQDARRGIGRTHVDEHNFNAQPQPARFDEPDPDIDELVADAISQAPSQSPAADPLAAMAAAASGGRVVSLMQRAPATTQGGQLIMNQREAFGG